MKTKALKQEPNMENMKSDKKAKGTHVRKVQPVKTSTTNNDPGCRPSGT